MNALITQYLEDLKSICKKLNVREMYLFGSALKNDFNSVNDLDFLVDFNPMSPKEYSKNYFELHDELFRIFGKKIDLVTMKTISNPYFKKEIESTRELLYAA